MIRHADKRESNLFIEQLLNGRDRHSAMEGIFMHCGIEAVPAVIERIKKKTASKRATDGNCYFYPNENDITLGLKFLTRHKPENRNIQQLFDYLLSKRRDKLLDDEIRVLEEVTK